MKKIISLIVSLIAWLSIYAQTSNDSLIRAAVIVDGLFFDKSVPAKSLIPGGSTMALLKDPEGKSVMAGYLPQGYVPQYGRNPSYRRATQFYLDSSSGGDGFGGPCPAARLSANNSCR